jgi:subtilase-type serine protease
MNSTDRLRSRLVCLVLLPLCTTTAVAIETYPGDPGTLGNPASWRTAEFLRDWGLRSVGAEFAYAAGFSGQGQRVGAVDSGFFDLHAELSPLRFSGVAVSGVPGAYNPAYNDTHGTHVVGTIAAARDGGAAVTNFHGVAFNAQVLVGNTRRTDSVLFGIPPASPTPAQTLDQAYVADVYRGVAAAGVRIVGSSWGSQPNTEQYQTLLPTTGTGLTGRVGLFGSWAFLARPDSWFQGALDAAAGGAVVAFSAGNTGYANPSASAAAAYFRPDLEGTWMAVAAIRQSLTVGGVFVGQSLNADGSVNVPGAQLYNQCGIAKWFCVTAPGNAINGSTVTITGGVPTATYGSLSGTSMAQPHASGALAVVMERYPYLNNEQALTVLRTTAVQNGTVNDAAGVAVPNPTRGQLVQVPDDRNGWGTVSLRHAMNGPGQFTGRFAVDTQGQNDTWSNAISDVAIRARRAEDLSEAAAWELRKIEKGWTNGLPPGAVGDDVTEYQTGVSREAARGTRAYAGSLDKLGAGTLTLSGANSWTGGTRVLAGRLVGTSETAFGSGDVQVLGGELAGNFGVGGNLFNVGGLVSPGLSLGRISVAGSFAQQAGASLWMEIGNDGADLLDIAGHALLGGSLGLSFLEGYGGGGLYTLIDAYSLDGSFASVTIAGLDPTLFVTELRTVDGALQLSVVAVPEPRAVLLLLVGLAALAWRGRRATQRGSVRC